jgi:hypothetical protein
MSTCFLQPTPLISRLLECLYRSYLNGSLNPHCNSTLRIKAECYSSNTYIYRTKLLFENPVGYITKNMIHYNARGTRERSPTNLLLSSSSQPYKILPSTFTIVT